ncbi:MAG: nuclear transport factor 2 family protein [Actinocrinis sp.]
MSATTTASATGALSADLFVDVQQFYARQMPLLEELRIEEFALTFTEDAVFEHVPDGWSMRGRAQLIDATRANTARYGESVFRHWFENRLIEPGDDGAVRVSYTALVSLTAPDGTVTFEPSCTVRDVLVRGADGVLRTSARRLRHDTSSRERYWAGQLSARS